MGVPSERLQPVTPGEQVANIKILPGFSMVNQPLYRFIYTLFRWRYPDPGGTPLSFCVEDEITLLHIGDAHETKLTENPDLLCLPWRTAPFQAAQYKKSILNMANRFSPRYILPIHYDLVRTEADPREIDGRTNATILNGHGWYGFENKKVVE